MMRTAFRYVLTVVAALFVGLLIFTAETIVDEVGYTATVRRLVSDGWSAMVDAGYSDWVFAGAFFFSGAAIALWLDYFLRPKRSIQTTKKKLEHVVSGKHIANSKVHLDGYRYENCTFQNVNFVYNGGYMEFQSNSISGYLISSEVPEINSFLRFAGEMRALGLPVYGDQGEIEFSGVTDGDEKPQEPSGTGA